MLDHHIQWQIIYTLQKSDGMTFTELKPGDIDNKLFTYHLRITMRDKFVEKNSGGLYRLTPTGEKLWKRMNEPPEEIALRAFSVLYLVIRSKEHGWLLYKRLSHPFKDRVAFMHALPNGKQSAVDAAHDWVLEKIGLECHFSPIGSGYFHTYKEADLDGFVHFTALICDSPSGTLLANDPLAEYFWCQDPDFSGSDMLPNMAVLARTLDSGQFPFFIDETVHL